MWDGTYDLVSHGLYQGSIPDARQTTFYDGFDVVVFCADPTYSFLSSFIPEDKIVIYAEVRPATLAIDVLRAQAQECADHLAAGKRVLILCVSGLYRSSVFAALVLAARGTSIAAAIEHVVALRDCGMRGPLATYFYRLSLDLE